MVNEEQELLDRKKAQEEEHAKFLVRIYNGFVFVSAVMCGFWALSRLSLWIEGRESLDNVLVSAAMVFVVASSRVDGQRWIQMLLSGVGLIFLTIAFLVGS